jgi:uncharacterized membrane protein
MTTDLSGGTALLAGGRVLNGLLAGVYLAFVVAVMPALRGLPDDTFVTVMNRINEVIVNPAFLAVFLGAPLLTVTLALTRREPVAIVAAVAAVIALVVTVVANVPLNDALAQGGGRASFEAPWTLWHYLRTAAATAAFVLLCLPGRR